MWSLKLKNDRHKDQNNNNNNNNNNNMLDKKQFIFCLYIFYFVLYSIFQAVQIPKIKIFRYDAPIYFGNADHFKTKLFKKLRVNLKKLSEKSKLDKEEKDEKKSLLEKNGYEEVSYLNPC